MKSIFSRIGGAISILLMITPAILVYYYNKLGLFNFLILMVISIFYISYQYRIILLENKIEDFIKAFLNLKRINKDFTYPNGKKATDKDKYNQLIEFVENNLNELTK